MRATGTPSASAPPTAVDVVVLGAGPIGTAIAWRCAQRGLSVLVVDPALDEPIGAWNTAAGMLAPVTELHFTETPLLRLGLASLAQYPQFVAELEAASGAEVGYRACGAVLAAWDAADLAAVRELHEFATGLGLETEMITGRELRALEPTLASGLPGGLHAPGDQQVDPRLLVPALRRAAASAGVHFSPAHVRVLHNEQRVLGVEDETGNRTATGTVVLAAGAWSRQVDGIPVDAQAPVRPAQGQTLRLRLPAGVQVNRIVRGWIKGSAIYLVPRPDARLIVGASVEERGFDRTPRVGAIYELLRDAQSLLPEISEAVLEEVSSGLRPGSPDNAPLIGPAALDGLVHATGHYRNGILLTPLTAGAVADLITYGHLPEVVLPFASLRTGAVAGAMS